MKSKDNKNNKSLKRIMICMDWYEPGFKAGGPIRSVSNIVNVLKKEFEFYILTSAFDLGETIPYPNIETNQWFDKDGVLVKYMSRDNMKSAAIKGNILEINPDVLYLNSLYSKLYTLVPLTLIKKIPVIIAPRGMLGAGALEIKKTKKTAFLNLARIIGLYKSVVWHASTTDEEKEIRQVFGARAKIVVAQNIPLAQVFQLNDVLSKKSNETVRFVFIGRIARVKNLHLAIQAIKNLQTTKKVEFEIYGNLEDEEYYNSFKNEISSNENISIRYGGVLNPGMIPETFLHASYLILPTMHENFGHAIVEAWSNGCPVIISKNTPWKNLRVRNLGWDVDISKPENLLAACQEAVDLDYASHITMVRESFNFFTESICDKVVIDDNRKLFDNVG
jgi:glycosyltransferase involved in cell wall biosynthesis